MTQIKVKQTIVAAGVREFSEAIGLAKTTVRYWHDENRIPAWREVAFLKAAKKLGIDPSNPPKTPEERA